MAAFDAPSMWADSSSFNTTGPFAVASGALLVLRFTQPCVAHWGLAHRWKVLESMSVCKRPHVPPSAEQLREGDSLGRHYVQSGHLDVQARPTGPMRPLSLADAMRR